MGRGLSPCWDRPVEPRGHWWSLPVGRGGSSWSLRPKFPGFGGRFTGATCPGSSTSFMAWFWTFPETNGTVQVELRVTNREFTQDLENPSSPTYKEFVQNFTEQVKGHETPPHTHTHLGSGSTWWMHPELSKLLHGIVRDGFGVGTNPKMRGVQEDEKGRGPTTAAGESSLPDGQDLRRHRGLQGHRGAAPQVSAGVAGMGILGSFHGGKKKGSLARWRFPVQAWQRGGGPHRHRVPDGDLAEPGEASEHHDQRAGEDQSTLR